MDARFLTRVGRAAALFAAVSAFPAWAGGGGHGGVMFHGGAFHGAPQRYGGWHVGGHALPPLAGVIHERPGMRPSYSAFGHTDTAVRFGGFGRGGFGGYGHVNTAPTSFGYGRRNLAVRGGARFARGGLLRGRVGFVGGGYGGGFGGYGGGFGGYGGFDVAAPGTGWNAGPSGGPYGPGSRYGGAGTSGQGGAYGLSYASEAPLAARFAEAPLAPSPGAPYSPDDRYAYAAAGDVGPGPRIIHVNRAARPDCGCGPRAEPVIYRYGVGTAY